MWNTLEDLILLVAIGGWLTLWLLRDLGHFGVCRGMASAPRPSHPSLPQHPGIQHIPPYGDSSAPHSPHNVARHIVDNVPEPLDEPGRHLGSGTRRHGRSTRRQPARSPHRVLPLARYRSSPLQSSPQQRSMMPGSTNHSRSNS